jgi:hypothetical protein
MFTQIKHTFVLSSLNKFDLLDTSHYALMARNQDNVFICLPASLLLQTASTINIQLGVLDIITISSKIICSRSMIHSLTY